MSCMCEKCGKIIEDSEARKVKFLQVYDLSEKNSVTLCNDCYSDPKRVLADVQTSYYPNLPYGKKIRLDKMFVERYANSDYPVLDPYEAISFEKFDVEIGYDDEGEDTFRTFKRAEYSDLEFVYREILKNRDLLELGYSDDDIRRSIAYSFNLGLIFLAYEKDNTTVSEIVSLVHDISFGSLEGMGDAKYNDELCLSFNLVFQRISTMDGRALADSGSLSYYPEQYMWSYASLLYEIMDRLVIADGLINVHVFAKEGDSFDEYLMSEIHFDEVSNRLFSNRLYGADIEAESRLSYSNKRLSVVEKQINVFKCFKSCIEKSGGLEDIYNVFGKDVLWMMDVPLESYGLD